MGLLTNPIFNKRESWGYVWILLIRGSAWTTWVFLSVAILKLSNNSVGCSAKGYEMLFNSTMNRTQTEEEANIHEIDCTGEVTWLGKSLTPSTAMPYLTSIGLVISMILTPIIGVIVDRTKHRKATTFASIGAFVAINGFQALISEGNWMVMLVLQAIFARICFVLHVSCVAAYCTEIAENEAEIIALQSAGRAFETGAMVGTLFSVIIGSTVLGFGKDVIATARFAQIFATACAIPFLVMSFQRFEEREALNKTTGNVLTAGFRQLFSTVKGLWGENRYVLHYLVGLAFNDGANGNVFVLFPIYAMLQVKLENPALFTGIAMIVCIPGVILTKWLGTKLGIRRQLGNILMSNAGITIFLILTAYKEGQTLFVLIVSIMYGLTMGGTYPMQKGLYMRLIPAGQEVEFQTLYAFAGQFLTPIPLAWFVFCEETQFGGEADSMRIGMLMLALFFILAFFLESFFLNEEKAVENAKKTEHLRLRPKVMIGGAKVGVDV